MAGSWVQEGAGGARPQSLPPVSYGTSDTGLGFPGLTAKAEEIKAETPWPSDLSQPMNYGLTELPGLAVRSGDWQGEPCSIGEGGVIWKEDQPCCAHMAGKGGAGPAGSVCIDWCGEAGREGSDSKKVATPRGVDR